MTGNRTVRSGRISALVSQSVIGATIASSRDGCHGRTSLLGLVILSSVRVNLVSGLGTAYLSFTSSPLVCVPFMAHDSSLTLLLLLLVYSR